MFVLHMPSPSLHYFTYLRQKNDSTDDCKHYFDLLFYEEHTEEEDEEAEEEDQHKRLLLLLFVIRYLLLFIDCKFPIYNKRTQKFSFTKKIAWKKSKKKKSIRFEFQLSGCAAYTQYEILVLDTKHCTFVGFFVLFF